MIKENFVPKYQKIIDDLRENVRSGVLAPGERLPVREELMQQYGVTRATVNRAMAELLREGLLVATPRAGTYVAERNTGRRSGGGGAQHTGDAAQRWTGRSRAITMRCSAAFSSCCRKTNGQNPEYGGSQPQPGDSPPLPPHPVEQPVAEVLKTRSRLSATGAVSCC